MAAFRGLDVASEPNTYWDKILTKTSKRYIRVNNPSLNRNIGKYHLPHIWDEVLFNISELKIK